MNARLRLLEGGDQRDLHLRLGAPDFRLSEPVRRFSEAVERGGNHLRRVPVGRAGVETEQSGVDEIPMKPEDRIGKAAFLPHLLEEPRRHASARRGGEDLGGVVIRRAGRAALEPDYDMGLLETPAELALA